MLTDGFVAYVITPGRTAIYYATKLQFNSFTHSFTRHSLIHVMAFKTSMQAAAMAALAGMVIAHA